PRPGAALRPAQFLEVREEPGARALVRLPLGAALEAPAALGLADEHHGSALATREVDAPHAGRLDLQHRLVAELVRALVERAIGPVPERIDGGDALALREHLLRASVRALGAEGERLRLRFRPARHGYGE